MGGFLTVLPLAFVMIAGPQIISAVFLATSVEWARNSLAYIVGAAISITLMVTIAYLVVSGLKSSADSSSSGREGQALDVVLLALLLFLAVNVYRKRNQAEPPKWMGKLQDAKPKFSFKLGFLLLGVFPTDIVTSATVGTKVARDGEPLWHTLGFVALTLLLLAIPALLVVVTGKRAQALLPRVRDWMNTNSWIVSEIVIALFIGIEISSLAGA
ncbi:GAP family protein [Aeromicrobium sp.]|uniref:GAP family protein n=1 Tax=Aeromicrobium sp. TaxID=1871063 RepID=UPI003D6A611A